MLTIKLAETSAEIAHCLSIREDVFIVEQNVPVARERDEYDSSALHFIAMSGNDAVGTARVVIKDHGTIAKIGRVAVVKKKRGFGIGKLLLAAIEAAPELRSVGQFVLESQTHALAFYEALGYEAHGDEFMDAGIPHRSMKKQQP